ncbi:hypothetical protein EIP86_007599 [Pleurotus ostreatoroseus]|nr:hypothetical protein EIP86_007599 [Pleurotus ostreatoroseus]
MAGNSRVAIVIDHSHRSATFKHALKYPFFTNYTAPEKYGLAPGKTLNFYLTTPDNETLGAWFVLSESIYQTLPKDSFLTQPNETVSYALTHAPTILFLHGAAGTRAMGFRVQAYHAFTSRLDCNIMAMDYRGFADSTGEPGEEGLVLDSYTAWDWLLQNGAKPEDILIDGHSLGTAVASQLAKRLAQEYEAANYTGGKPRGVVLRAPFTTAIALAESYPLLGLPILQPLQKSSLGRKFLRYVLATEFDTLAAVSDFHIPTLIAHSRLDEQIPFSHAQTLIDKLLSPLLPPEVTPPTPGSPSLTEEFAAFTKAQNDRREARLAVVQKREIPNFGVVEEFDRDGSKGSGEHKVVYVETIWGNHVDIGSHEGVQDEMARVFKLGPYAT